MRVATLPDGNRVIVLALGKDALDLAENAYHGFNLPS